MTGGTCRTRTHPNAGVKERFEPFTPGFAATNMLFCGRRETWHADHFRVFANFDLPLKISATEI
jgi:hypothetical protein